MLFWFVLAYVLMLVASLMAGFAGTDVRYPKTGIGNKRRGRRLHYLTVVTSAGVVANGLWLLHASPTLPMWWGVGMTGFVWFFLICAAMIADDEEKIEYAVRLGKQ